MHIRSHDWPRSSGQLRDRPRPRRKAERIELRLHLEQLIGQPSDTARLPVRRSARHPRHRARQGELWRIDGVDVWRRACGLPQPKATDVAQHLQRRREAGSWCHGHSATSPGIPRRQAPWPRSRRKISTSKAKPSIPAPANANSGGGRVEHLGSALRVTNRRASRDLDHVVERPAHQTADRRSARHA